MVGSHVPAGVPLWTAMEDCLHGVRLGQEGAAAAPSRAE